MRVGGTTVYLKLMKGVVHGNSRSTTLSGQKKRTLGLYDSTETWNVFGRRSLSEVPTSDPQAQTLSSGFAGAVGATVRTVCFRGQIRTGSKPRVGSAV